MKEHDILQQLKHLQEKINLQEERITFLEQKIGKPSYDIYAKSLETHTSSKKRKHTTFSWSHITPLCILVGTTLLGYFLFKPPWHSPFYQGLLLMYATVLFSVGLFLQNKTIRIFSYVCYGLGLLLIIITYKCNHLFHPQTSTILHSILGCIALTLGVARVCLYYAQTSSRLTPKEHRFLPLLFDTALAITLFIWGATAIILYFDRVSGQPSFFLKPFIEHSRAEDTLLRTDISQLLLTLYYFLYASITLCLGIRLRERALRCIGYCIAILAGYSTWVLIKTTTHTYYIVFVILFGLLVLGTVFYCIKKKIIR